MVDILTICIVILQSHFSADIVPPGADCWLDYQSVPEFFSGIALVSKQTDAFE